MKKTRTVRLRWQLALPLAVAFAILWLGTMILLTNSQKNTLERTVDRYYQDARQELEEQWDIYQSNLERGLGEKAASVMEDNLSSAGMYLTGIEGGMALVSRDEAGNVIRSQLAWGVGNEEGVDRGQRWHLRLDEGLDDLGQMDLAHWIVANRCNGWDYSLYPVDSSYAKSLAEFQGDDTNCDGTVARVTGVAQPGDTILVQSIDLVHPDGTTETMVETSVETETPITVELPYLRMFSVLLPSWSSSGKDGPVDMEERLANFRQAQAISDRELAGQERSVVTAGGRMTGLVSGESSLLRVVTGQCDVMRAAFRQLRLLYIGTFLLMVLVVLLLSARLSETITRPAEQLCRQVQQGTVCQAGSVTELSMLAAAFNDARDQLAGQLERERAFTRGAAHELKTPLTVLSAHAEALQQDILPEKRQAYLEIIQDESRRMTELVTSLLELSRLQAGAELVQEPVELAGLCQKVWQRLEVNLEQKQLLLELEPVTVMGDGERLREALENLATNALRHCREKGIIRVGLKKTENRAHLTVYNDGSPIPDVDLPHLFEPFYRGDKGRSRHSGGTGLGLAIVQAAALVHAGECRVENSREGVTFILTLPALPETDAATDSANFQGAC